MIYMYLPIIALAGMVVYGICQVLYACIFSDYSSAVIESIQILAYISLAIILYKFIVFMQ